MRTWTLEERYRVLKKPEEIVDLYENIKDSKYRQKYHIQPMTGLLSDPNGFAFYNDKWHLFYQWCPWGAVHGLKYWYHVTSKDLIHWENEGIGIKPDTYYDNRGVHSGSAFTEDDILYLFYTGNHRDDNWVRTPYTCLAIYDNELEKLEKPLFGPREEYTEHQRDPKVIYCKDKDKYYIFIGAQDKDEKGSILIYSSDKLDSGWKFEGPLKIKGLDNIGGMYECPNLIQFEDKDVLIFSPQYIKLPNRNNSTNHSIYFIGKIDFDDLVFIPDKDYDFLDYGFDFYAAQAAHQSDEMENPILIGWIGLPDNHYPSEDEDWEGSLSIPRELKIIDNNLIQNPVNSINSIIKEEITEYKLPKACKIEVKTLNKENFYLNLFTKDDLSGGLKLNYDSSEKILKVAKNNLDKRFNTEIGEVLEVPFTEGIDNFDIYVDSNSVEIFFNSGEKTFSAHIYPSDKEKFIDFSSNIELHIWRIENSIKNYFKV